MELKMLSFGVWLLTNIDKFCAGLPHWLVKFMGVKMGMKDDDQIAQHNPIAILWW